MEEEIFEKKYYKIKDVAEFIGVPQSTLRFWEKEFPEINPRRSQKGIRYYTPADIRILKIIYFLIKTRGLKIDAAKKELHANRKNISKKIEIIRNLENVRYDLQGLLSALSKRK